MNKSDLYVDIGALSRAEKEADVAIEAMVQRIENVKAHAADPESPSARLDGTSRIKGGKGTVKPYHIDTGADGRYYWRFNIEGFIPSRGGPFDASQEAESAAMSAAPTQLWESQTRAFTTNFATTPVQWLGDQGAC